MLHIYESNSEVHIGSCYAFTWLLAILVCQTSPITCLTYMPNITMTWLMQGTGAAGGRSLGPATPPPLKQMATGLLA
jgi:hypothetical protein